MFSEPYLLVKITNKGKRLYVFGRSEDGKESFVDDSFAPYFYAEDSCGDYCTYDGKLVRKVFVSDPKEVPRARSFYPSHYEADIPYTVRYMIDKDLRSGFRVNIDTKEIVPCDPPDISPRLVFFDIEVSSGGSAPDVESASDPVVCLTVWDSYSDVFVTLHSFFEERTRKGNWYIYGFTDEVEMLEALHKLFEKLDPDIVSGWYIVGSRRDSSPGFDVPYLQNRLSRLGLRKLSFERTQLIDGMSCFKRLVRSSSWKLKDFAESNGYNVRYGYSFDEVKDDPEKILLYNWQDVDILRWLEEKYRAVMFHWSLKCVAGVNNMRDTLSNMRIIDVLYLRKARSEGVILPSKARRESKSNLKGGLVFSPAKGIYRYVGSFDYSRYYPAIIMSLNLSPEGRGLFPKIIGELLLERDKIEREMLNHPPGSFEYNILELKSSVVKFITNSVYGVLSNPNFRLYSPEISSTITSTAREGLVALRNYLESLGYSVIYGDTDSSLVKLKGDSLEKCVEEGLRLQEELNRYIAEWFAKRFGVEKVYLKVKFERVFEKILFTEAKKRYAGKVVWEKGKECSYILYRGFEVVRTDQSVFTKELQSRLIELLLEGGDRESVKSFLRQFIRSYRDQPIEKVAIIKNINKSLDSYKAMSPHVRGAIYSNRYFKTNFKRGDTVMMLWVKRVQGFPYTDVVCFDKESVKKLPKIEVDWERMIESSVRGKVEELIKLVGLSWNEIISSESFSVHF